MDWLLNKKLMFYGQVMEAAFQNLPADKQPSFICMPHPQSPKSRSSATLFLSHDGSMKIELERGYQAMILVFIFINTTVKILVAGFEKLPVFF